MHMTITDYHKPLLRAVPFVDVGNEFIHKSHTLPVCDSDRDLSGIDKVLVRCFAQI